MSIYYKNYTKLNDGYNKIMNTIESIDNGQQLGCVSNMINNWVNLIDIYCNEVYRDKTNPRRKKEAVSLAEAGKDMFEFIKDFYQFKVEEFQPVNCNGAVKYIRIKPLNEFDYGR